MPDEPKVSAEVETNPVVPPVQQWSDQPPAQAQVQYVVASKSLDGLGGWLMFWMVMFAIAGLSYVGTFFSGLGAGASNASEVVLMIFSPLLAVGYVSSVVFMALRKKLGKLLAMAVIALTTLYIVISAIVSLASTGASSADIGSAVGGMIMSIIFGGLMILYFVASKRVKATLVN